MTQYHKIDIKNLEQNFYFAFIENLHITLINSLKESSEFAMSSNEINMLSTNIRSNYISPIMTEIQKMKIIKKNDK